MGFDAFFGYTSSMMFNLPVFWQFVVIVVSGWINQRQQSIIEYLKEENRILREQLGDKRIRFTDKQRRRLAEKAKRLGRSVLRELDPFDRSIFW